MPTPLPVVVIGAVVPTDQAAVALALQCDLPAAVVVRHELDVRAGVVRTVVSDLTGVVERREQPLEHACLGCALREDVVPTLLAVARSGRWQEALVVLPPTSGLLAVVTALGSDEVSPGITGEISLRSVVAVVSGSDIAGDVFGDDTLDERGLGVLIDDPRPLGEIVTGQIELADSIVLAGERLDELDRAVIDHLRRPTSAVVHGTEGLDAAALFAQPHRLERSRADVDPRTRVLPAVTDSAELGLVTIELASWKPFHPGRLAASFSELAGGPTRARGVFWLPSRPGLALAWEDAGGQLSLGEVSPWGEDDRRTRLVVTTDPETAEEISACFDHVLMTDLEMVSGPARWAGRADGFEEWLGEQGAA